MERETQMALRKTKSPKTADTTSIELFAGAGGLALGTARAGFRHAAVVDWDLNAIQTLQRNRDDDVDHVRNWVIARCDVTEYDFGQHRDQVDFIFGGPPCQPFSIFVRYLRCRRQRDRLLKNPRKTSASRPSVSMRSRLTLIAGAKARECCSSTLTYSRRSRSAISGSRSILRSFHRGIFSII